MNEALELACKLDAYARGDEYQRVTEEAAAVLCSQHAEIEGWKKDQKENLRNQCDLHAEIERLKADANTCGSGAGCLRKEATIDSQAAEIERLNNGWHMANKELLTESLELRAENQRLRKVLESVATMSEELSISGFARAALEETK